MEGVHNPKKVGEIGERRKGVAVVFPFCLLCLRSLTNGLMGPWALGQTPNKLARSNTPRNMPTLSLSIRAPAPMAPPDLIQLVSPVNLPVFLLILPVNLLVELTESGQGGGPSGPGAPGITRKRAARRGAGRRPRPTPLPSRYWNRRAGPEAIHRYLSDGRRLACGPYEGLAPRPGRSARKGKQWPPLYDFQ